MNEPVSAASRWTQRALSAWAVVTLVWVGSLLVEGRGQLASACSQHRSANVVAMSRWQWWPPGPECSYVLSGAGDRLDGARGVIVDPAWTGPVLIVGGWVTVLAVHIAVRRAEDPGG